MEDRRVGGPRVVVTGMGAVTPLALNLPETWQALLEGKSGAGPITHFDAEELGLETTIAAEVKGFDPTNYMDKKEARRTDRFTQLAIAAAREALESAALRMTDAIRDQAAAIIGTGVGGLSTIVDQVLVFKEKGARRVSPFTVPMLMPNAASANVSLLYGLRAINFAPTSACSAGADAIGVALDLIRSGRAKVVLAGGSEACIVPISVAAFNQAGALSTKYNDRPEKASRPFDAGRDGFLIGEGAALLVLEEEEFALARGAPILAELAGYGATADAYHITAPPEDGHGAVRAMREALRDAGLTPKEVDYINAHGTSTPLNDKAETLAIKTVLGERAYQLPVSSIKSMTGHLVGASGALEAAICVLTLLTGWVPPTINYETPDPACDLDYVPNQPRKVDPQVVMSNSFGFGGHDSTLIFRNYVA